MKRMRIADCGLRRAQARRLRNGPATLFVVTLALGLLTSPLAAEAQQSGKVYRVGFLGNSTAALEANLVGPFREGLRDLGYVEGRNILIEYRWAEGEYARFPALIAELVALQVGNEVSINELSTKTGEGKKARVCLKCKELIDG